MAIRLALLLAFAAIAVAKQDVSDASVPPTPEPTPIPGPPPPATPCGKFACPEFDIIDSLTGGVSIRRYKPGMWVKFPVPGDDFIFMAEYGDEKLGGFFQGENYEHKIIKKSTPLRVQFNVWDLTVQRWASYFVPNEEQSIPPAAVPPARIDKHEEIFMYVKEYNDTMDFRTVCKNVAEGMVDLTIDGEPFDLNNVYLAMYSYPKLKKGDFPRQNDEIWYVRTFKHWDSPSSTALREGAEEAERAFDFISRKLK